MKSYKLILSNQADHALERIQEREPELFRRVVNALDGLEKNPFQGKPLKGELKGCYSYRIGTYRIVYRIEHHQLLVIVIDIGHRRDIYK